MSNCEGDEHLKTWSTYASGNFPINPVIFSPANNFIPQPGLLFKPNNDFIFSGSISDPAVNGINGGWGRISQIDPQVLYMNIYAAAQVDDTSQYFYKTLRHGNAY